MRSFRDWSLRTKLTALSVTASAAALVLACAGFVAYDVATFPEATARKLATQAEIVGYNSAGALVFDDAENARNTLESLRAEARIVGAALYDESEKVFARYTRGAPQSVPIPDRLPATITGDHPFGSEYSFVSRPVIFDGQEIGSVALWSEAGEVRERALRYLGIALLVLVASLGVAFLISSWPRRVILRPILQLVETTDTVSRQRDYSVRATRTGDDELGALVDAFNDMLGNIERRSAELEEARDHALEASRLKSAFLANMSHEVRTPLNVILGYNDLIADHLDEIRDPTLQMPLDAVQRASERLITTIDGILDISRMETRTFEVTPVLLDLREIVEGELRSVRSFAAQKGLKVSCAIEVPEAIVSFDRYCLTRSLANLLQNAVKFTRAGEVTIRLHRHASGDLAIDVTDSGVGIDPAFLPRLFEPFTQEESGYTRKFEGSGLGLALAKRYLEMNGAAIVVESDKGRGTTFTVRFSRDSEVPGERPEKPSVPDEATAGEIHPAEPIRAVLVVEDHPDTRAYVKTILDGKFVVFEASTPDEARHVLENSGERIRLILLDLALSADQDGLDLARSLRSDPRWAALPIIATTAHVFPDDRSRARDAGCDRFLAKPIHHRLLLSVMEEELARHPGN